MQPLLFNPISHLEPSVEIPPTVSLERAHTLNGYGYIFYQLSPLLDDFLTNEAHPSSCLIEVGSGFNNAPIEALKRGVSEYWANDLMADHLKILSTRAELALGKKSSNLKLLSGKAPEVLPNFLNYYDAILADKVLHFFNQKEIEDFMNWALQALKPGAKLYLLTISPYIPSLRDKILPLYLKQKEDYPSQLGYSLHVEGCARKESQNANPGYQVPSQMTFFDLETIKSCVEKSGFQVLKSYSLMLPTENCSWSICEPQESALVGVMAQKPFI